MWWATRLLRYLYLKSVVTLLRTLFKWTRPAIVAKKLQDAFRIPSRDAKRTIAVHLYFKDVSPSTPQPTLINFHGSGMIFPAFGEDDEFCHYISQNTEYVVLDFQYRLAPENPFPAAVHDVEDAVQWVLNQPEKFDLSRLSISGFSAGGNLALVASGVLLPRHTFRSVLAFYPGTDFTRVPEEMVAPDPQGKAIPPGMARMFRNCYIPVGVDARDPRISPLFADPDNYPERALVITAARDNMAPEAEDLAALLKKRNFGHVVSQRIEECEHGFDKRAVEGSAHAQAKETVYAMAVNMLKE